MMAKRTGIWPVCNLRCQFFLQIAECSRCTAKNISCFFDCDCLHQRICGEVKLTMSSPPTSNVWSRVIRSEKASTSCRSIFQNSRFIFRSPVLSADKKFMRRDSNDSRLSTVQAALRKHCVNVLRLDWNSSVLWFRHWMACTNCVVSNIAPAFFGWTEGCWPSTRGWGSARVWFASHCSRSWEKAQRTCVLAQAFVSITNPHISKYTCIHSFHRTLTIHARNCMHIHQSVLQFHKWKHYVVNCHLGTPPPHTHPFNIYHSGHLEEDCS